MRRRDLHRPLRIESYLTLDLAVFSGVATLCLVVVLAQVPMARVAAGIVLLIGVQGVGGTAALVPAGAGRRGFTAIAALVGMLLTILEGLVLDAVGLPLTRVSVTVTGYLATLVLLLVAGARRTMPVITFDRRTVGAGLLMVAGMSWAVVVAVNIAQGIPRYAPAGGYSTVALSGDLASLQGVVSTPVGTPVPVEITISNREERPRTYQVIVDPGSGVAPRTGNMTVPAGGDLRVDLGEVTVRDGCVHAYPVHVVGAQRYELTLYARGADAPCPT